MIGVFDSGSGGLTVVRALRERAPDVDILYLADTANMPYGEKTDDEIRFLTLRMLQRLRGEGATTIVSACNSISATVIRPFFDLFGVTASSLVEMVEPAVRSLVKEGIAQAIVLATPATARSRMYERIGEANGIHIETIACPELAEFIERDGAAKHVTGCIEDALKEVPSNIRHMLFGCTHYPLVRMSFEEAARRLERDIIFHDPADAVADAALALHGKEGSGRLRVESTKPLPAFERRAAALRAGWGDCQEQDSLLGSTHVHPIRL